MVFVKMDAAIAILASKAVIAESLSCVLVTAHTEDCATMAAASAMLDTQALIVPRL